MTGKTLQAIFAGLINLNVKWVMVRNYLFIIIIFFTAASCATVQPVSKKSAKSISPAKTPDANLQFINGIEAGQEKTAVIKTGKPADNKIVPAEPKSVVAHSTDIEKAKTIQFTYANKLGTEVEAITNFKLFEIIDEWWGTPYRMGGHTKAGIDCSAFVNTLLAGVYAVNLPRTAREQYAAVTKITNDELSEGDLVFFNTRGGISHVGVYLTNNKFVHASTSGGVMISDLNESYWKARYKGAGRAR